MGERRRPRARRIGRTLAVLVTALLALAACTGVPTSSAPQTIAPIGLGEGVAAAAVAPRPGAGPREIVEDFLQANQADPVRHSAAREFLTSSARNRWSDTTATIVSDLRIGTYDSQKHSLTVTARKVGTLDALRGIYTPTLDGAGHGAATLSFVFGLDPVAGQYRINALSNGLLLTEDQFRSAYVQRVVYFYDSAERYLVPDMRYSALNDAVQLSDWLLGQLNGPSPSLQSVVSTDTLPAQARQMTVRINSSSTTVQIPGSRQLSSDVRNRLAAQVAFTLTKAVHIGEITIEDGDAAVSIPLVNSTRFSEADFEQAAGPVAPPLAVYYLNNGRIRTQRGAPLSGPLGNGAYLFDSVALARPAAIGQLTVAGVQGTGSQQRLLIGTQHGEVHQTSIVGRLSRPSWAPGLPEVWIGDGPKVYRVTTDGRTSTVAAVPIPAAAGGGRVVSLRLSPDGSRVALVLAGANGRPALYVGPVVRNGKTVEVESLQAISPERAVVQDVAWVDSLRMYAIGYIDDQESPGVFDVRVDGSAWNDLGISNLPKQPSSITATTDGPPWVASDGASGSTVWVQNGINWESPLPGGDTTGKAPIYLS
jgi:lipoprotein LpqB-like beta-propeller protein